VGLCSQLVETLAGCGRFEIEGDVGAHPAREIQPITRRPDCKDRRRATQTCKRNRAQPDGARSLHEHRVSRTKCCALQDVDRGQETATTPDIAFEGDRVWQTRDPHSWLEIHELRPTAEEPLRG
jgi:hypothetical protein